MQQPTELVATLLVGSQRLNSPPSCAKQVQIAGIPLNISTLQTWQWQTQPKQLVGRSEVNRLNQEGF